jgi:hypothetical protein
VAGELERATTSGCGRPADRPITSVVSRCARGGSGLLRRAGDDVGLQVEEHQQVAQVGGEEGHLVGAGDQDALGAVIASMAASTWERDSLRAVSSTFTWSAAIAVSNSLWSRRRAVWRCRRACWLRSLSRRGSPARRRRGGGTPPRLGLQLGEALEAERLREPHDGRRRGVRATGELLGGLERHLVQVVDDVLRDVLLDRENSSTAPGCRRRGSGVRRRRGARRWGQLPCAFMGRALVRRRGRAFPPNP